MKALNAYCPVRTGLGTLARWWWNELPFDRYMAIKHPQDIHGWGEIDAMPRNTNILQAANPVPEMIDAYYQNITHVHFLERPFPMNLPHLLPHKGVNISAFINAEWFHSDLIWARHCNRFICPNYFTFQHVVKELKRADIPTDKAIHIPLPLRLSELPFRQRTIAKRFCHAPGNGGTHGRKGTHLVPSNVDILSPAISGPSTTADIWKDVDVAVQPHLFDGAALAIAECLAMGIPTMVLDWPPMNEYIIDALGRDAASKYLIPVDDMRDVEIWNRPWSAATANPETIKRCIAELSGTDISFDSWELRNYMKNNHQQWDRLWQIISCG